MINEQNRLIKRKQEIEQLILNKQEQHGQFDLWGGNVSPYTDYPADLASHLQVLNIELEKINETLSQYNH